MCRAKKIKKFIHKSEFFREMVYKNFEVFEQLNIHKRISSCDRRLTVNRFHSLSPFRNASGFYYLCAGELRVYIGDMGGRFYF